MRIPQLQNSQSTVMTIDIEDWFQVENLKPVITRDSWDTHELRVVRNTEQMMQILDEQNIRCTFFVLGWVAEKVPTLIRNIANAGHEIASHGYGHELIYRLSGKDFRRDVERSKYLLEDLTGRQVRGYRAPSFSITDWAIPILQDLGFSYDSSMFAAMAHDRYGKLSNADINKSISELRPGFVEVSVSCMRWGPYRLPWGGGGYFRLIPYPIFKFGIGQILASGNPYVFYLHPWEIDPDQPRIGGLTHSHRFRHYVNLGKCKSRWQTLLGDFKWCPIESLLTFDNEFARA